MKCYWCGHKNRWYVQVPLNTKAAEKSEKKGEPHE